MKCDRIRCRHHLLLDVHPSRGSIVMNFPSLEQMRETCALDVAERGGHERNRVGDYLGVTQVRARQLELLIFAKLKKKHLPILKEMASHE